MKQLFDREGLAALEAFCRAKTLFAFDYDGTLAPLVDNPSEAGMRNETKRLLGELSAWVPVAVISGRKRSDLTSFLPRSVDFMVGNHGLEGSKEGGASLGDAARCSQEWSKLLKQRLAREEGIVLEDKLYSLTLHYRLAADKVAAQATIAAAIQGLSPAPRIILGKDVVNLLADGTPHKGTALLELRQRAGADAAVFCGDDDNDEDAFRLEEARHLCVRVGARADSAAAFYLDSQTDMDQMLRLCLGFFEKSEQPRRSVATHSVMI